MTPIGDVLRAAREARGISLDEASAATKIRVTYLRALEDERFDVISGSVYVRGFLRSYAAYLGLDPEPVVAAYRAREPVEEPPLAPQPARGRAPTGLNRRGPNWLAVGIVCVAILLVIAVVSLLSSPSGSGNAATATTSKHPVTTTTVPPTTTAPPKTVTLTLRITAPSWTEVTTNGKIVFEGTLYPGQQQSFTSGKTINVVLGYPAGVTLVVDGKNLGVAGPANEVYRGSFPA